MNHGVTVEPAYDSEGNYVDSVIKAHPNDAATDHNGMSRGWENDYYQDEFGQTHHLFEDTQLADPSEPQSFDFDDYQTNLEQTIPHLYEAIQWVADTEAIPIEELEAYNQAIDNEDLATMHMFYERLLPLYEQAMAEQGIDLEETEDIEQFFDDEEVSDDDEFYQNLEEEGVIDQTLDYLMDEDFELSQSQIYALDSVTYAYEEGTPEHAIATVAMDVATGYTSMEDAIAQVCETYGDVAAAKAYFSLQQLLNDWLWNLHPM